MKHDFYNSKEYRELQSQKMKESWKKGLFDFRYNQEERVCARDGCKNIFQVKKSDQKVYCGSSCAAKVNNIKRGPRPESVRLKISQALEGTPNPYKGIRKVPLAERICVNPKCNKKFFCERYERKKFCSIQCAMAVIGGKPTSPKASRGKAGIRKDINNHTYFYSRWEANVARLFNYLNIEWVHELKTFNLKTAQTPHIHLI